MCNVGINTKNLNYTWQMKTIKGTMWFPQVKRELNMVQEKIILIEIFAAKNYISKVKYTKLSYLITYLNWQTIFQIQQARLANILQLATSLTYLRLLEPHTSTRTPSEDCKRPSADLALFAILLLRLNRHKQHQLLQKEEERKLTILMQGLSPKQVWHRMGKSWNQ